MGIRRLAALAVVAGSVLSAGELKFGVAGAMAVPTDELRVLVNDKTGFTVGVFVLKGLGNGHVLRPRLDYYQTTLGSGYNGPLAYPGGLGNVVLAEHERVTCWSLGLDLVRYLREYMDWGPYVLVGLGGSINRYQITVNENTAAGSAASQAGAQSTKLYADVGFGYQLNASTGLEVAYHRSVLGGQVIVASGSAVTTAGSTSLETDHSLPNQVLGYVSIGVAIRF